MLGVAVTGRVHQTAADHLEDGSGGEIFHVSDSVDGHVGEAVDSGGNLLPLPLSHGSVGVNASCVVES